jgi:hypothetical protein
MGGIRKALNRVGTILKTNIMASLINLNNSSNTVHINVAQADNFISIYLNPDSGSVGFVKVYESHQMDMGVPANVSIDLTNYLQKFRQLNPAAHKIVMAVCLSNFAGPGPYHYEISGTFFGTPLIKTGTIPTWESIMQSYSVNIYP